MLPTISTLDPVYTAKDSGLIAELMNALGADAVCLGDTVDARYLADWSGAAPVRPLALLRPRTTQEVAAAMRICHRHRVPVVPQGGLTGLAGAAMPQVGAIALSLWRMQTIEHIDVQAATITVQAGATLQAVQEAALAAGMVFGVDLGARGSCQIGGNLATNAGGNGVVQYGMMRAQTLGLEVVLADGTVLPMLRPLRKNNTGYDLNQWFIGSEGTLGIITRAVLTLHAAPRARISALIALPDYAAATRLLSRLQAGFPGALAAFELMWADFFTTSLRWSKTSSPLSASYPFTALVEITGTNEAELAQSLQRELECAMEEGCVLDAVVAQSHAQAHALWRIREATAEFPTHMLPLNFDLSLALEQIGAFSEQCVQALSSRWPTQRSLRFGHLGDGNLHLTIDLRSLGDEASAAHASEEAQQLVYALTEQWGGSISAEHGIGLHKKPYLSASRSPAELATMRAIKHALDPFNLLNPGKVFDFVTAPEKAAP
jgi:FAD/FMN-containing dehydrogenase